VFVLKTLVRELILPPTSLLLLTLIGALLVWRRRRLGWGLFIAGFGSLWLLCTPVVSDRVAALAERRIRYCSRLTLAAYLAQHYSLPLAVSGADSESVAMAATLTRNFGTPPQWLEGHSRDTFENAQLSAKMLFPVGVKRIILVTSSAHEWRAVQEFKGAGFQVLPAPAGVFAPREYGFFSYLPSATALQRSYAAVYELIGEPMRRLLAVGAVREKLAQKVRAGR
jgi:hypothetical protein